MTEAVKQMPINKSTGNDAVPVEVFKCLDDTSLSKLYNIVSEIWREEKVPQDLKDAKFVQLFKNKGDKSDCNNYRGTSLLNIFSKIVSRIILPRLQALGQRIYPESQCGYRPGRSTTDMIFSVRQIQEKCRGKNIPLYMAFVDFTKVFDKVSRNGLYIILSKLGCPEKLLNIVKSFHDGMKASLIYEGMESSQFDVKNGVKQGCVLAPVLFNIYFSYLIKYAFDNNQRGVYLHSRLDGSLFNVTRFQTK